MFGNFVSRPRLIRLRRRRPAESNEVVTDDGGAGVAASDTASVALWRL